MDIYFKLCGPIDKVTNFTVAGALYDRCSDHEDLDPETIARMILQQCDCDRYKPDKGERESE